EDIGSDTGSVAPASAAQALQTAEAGPADAFRAGDGGVQPEGRHHGAAARVQAGQSQAEGQWNHQWKAQEGYRPDPVQGVAPIRNIRAVSKSGAGLLTAVPS